MRAPLIPSDATPILRPEFVALQNAGEFARRARRLRSPDNTAPEHEAKPLALQLIEDAIAQLVAARLFIDPPPAQEKTDG